MRRSYGVFRKRWVQPPRRRQPPRALTATPLPTNVARPAWL